MVTRADRATSALVVGPLFDLKDTTAACDADNWNRNVFNTRNQTCIH